MPHILITDDDMHLRRLVRTYAELEGFDCIEAADGASAVTALKQGSFDLVLLDVMMPGPDGFETLEAIRKFSQVPVIMLTARTEEYDRLNGFQLGVDDYVSKPFSPKELMARIKAVLRRTQAKVSAPVLNELTFSGLSIFPDSRMVTLEGQRVSLPPKEFDLLYKLAQNEHIVLSRDKLLETVWGYQYCGDARTVDTHVKSLREHLGTYRKFIQTVWGVGYKFEEPDEK